MNGGKNNVGSARNRDHGGLLHRQPVDGRGNRVEPAGPRGAGNAAGGSGQGSRRNVRLDGRTGLGLHRVIPNRQARHGAELFLILILD